MIKSFRISVFILFMFINFVSALSYIDGRMVSGMVRLSTNNYNQITNLSYGLVHTNDYILLMNSIAGHPAGLYQRTSHFNFRFPLTSTNWLNFIQTGKIATNSVVITKFSVQSNKIISVSNSIMNSITSPTNGIGARISAVSFQTLAYGIRFIRMSNRITFVSNLSLTSVRSSTNGFGAKFVSVTGQTLTYGVRFVKMSNRITALSNLIVNTVSSSTNGFGAKFISVTKQTQGYGLKFINMSNRITMVSNGIIIVSFNKIYSVSNYLFIRITGVSNASHAYAYQRSVSVSNGAVQIAGYRSGSISNILASRISSASNSAVFWAGYRAHSISNFLKNSLINLSNKTWNATNGIMNHFKTQSNRSTAISNYFEHTITATNHVKITFLSNRITWVSNDVFQGATNWTKSWTVIYATNNNVILKFTSFSNRLSEISNSLYNTAFLLAQGVYDQLIVYITNKNHLTQVIATNLVNDATNQLHNAIPTPTYFGTNTVIRSLIINSTNTNNLASRGMATKGYVAGLGYVTSSITQGISSHINLSSNSSYQAGRTADYIQDLTFASDIITTNRINTGDRNATNSITSNFMVAKGMATKGFSKSLTNGIYSRATGISNGAVSSMTNWDKIQDLTYATDITTTNRINAGDRQSTNSITSNFMTAKNMATKPWITNWDLTQDAKYCTNIVLYTNQISTPTNNAIIVSSNLKWDYQLPFGSADTNAKSKLFFDSSLSTGLYLTNYNLVSIKGSISYQFGSLTTINQWKIYCVNMFNENFNLMASNSSGWINLNHYNLRNDGSGILVSSIFTNNVGYLKYKLSVSNYSPSYVPLMYEIQYFFWKPPLSIRQYIDTNNLALAKRDLQFVTNMSTVSYTVQVSTPTNVTTIIQSNFSSSVPKSFFDGNIATAGGTIGSTGNAAVSYGFNQSWVVNNYAIYYQTGGGGTGYSVTVVLFGSNSGWTQLDSQAYGSFGAGWQTINIANTSAYYRYKVEVLASYPLGGSFGMNEVALYNVGPRPNHYFMTNVFNQLIVSPTNTIQSRVTRISNTINTIRSNAVWYNFISQSNGSWLMTPATNRTPRAGGGWTTITNVSKSDADANTNYIVYDVANKALRVNTLGAGWYVISYNICFSNVSAGAKFYFAITYNGIAVTSTYSFYRGVAGDLSERFGMSEKRMTIGDLIKLTVSQDAANSVKIVFFNLMIRRFR